MGLGLGLGLGWDGSPGGRGYRAPYGANNSSTALLVKEAGTQYMFTKS